LKRGVYILPNLITTGTIFGGFYAAVAIMKGNLKVACWAIFFAMVMDALDGKVARLSEATSSFGVQYDSLCDLVAFGVAPAMLLYFWALSRLGRTGWMLAFLYLTCGALRLARFNVQASHGPNTKSFTGLPIPAAAAVVATTYLFTHGGGAVHASATKFEVLLVAAIALCTAMLMVSNIPYVAFKEGIFNRRYPFMVLFCVILGVAVVLSEPTISLWVLAVGYASWGPVAWLVKGRRRAVGEDAVCSAEAEESQK
jgi:CDP-diacylglycerol--serine O-phosphatidyltransferase